MKSKQWHLIENEAEEDAVWEAFNRLLHFTPDFGDKVKCPFDFSKISESVIAYDISGIFASDFEAHDENGNYKTTECITILKSAFADCMGEDEFMYALEWQHGTFKYNPRIDAAYGCYVMYSSLPDTRAYYPDFHPNGDYFFFVSKDFSGGYLTHPWQKRVWFYGSKLVGLIKKQEEKLGFKHIDFTEKEQC